MGHGSAYLILTAFIILIDVTVHGAQLSRKFKYRNTECKWTEIKTRRGPGPRTLSLKCQSLQLFCEYKGNPHPCKAYNKRQADYYQCLANTLSGKGDLCDMNSNTNVEVSCPSMCQEIDFKRQPNGYVDVEPKDLIFEEMTKGSVNREQNLKDIDDEKDREYNDCGEEKKQKNRQYLQNGEYFENEEFVGNGEYVEDGDYLEKGEYVENGDYLENGEYVEK